MLPRAMRSYRRFPSPALSAVLAAVLVTVLGASAGTAHAAPAAGESQGDAIVNLLRDRGLLPGDMPAEAQNVVRQMRDKASELVMSAMNFLGVPYRRGGSSLDEGFDCSGFTRHIFELSVGMVLPRRAEQQANQAGLMKVARDELKPGDLVFFNTMRRAFSHVGIYIGDGKFIHSPRVGGEVRIEDMRMAYWNKRFDGARRADLGGQPVDSLVRDATNPNATPR
jgi:cell wall-associated NlpC family hydrolase